VSTTPKGSRDVEAQAASARDPFIFRHEPRAASDSDPKTAKESQPLEEFQLSEETQTLGSLPIGARLILRCRADWRVATVAAFDTEMGRVVLNVASPTGHTYRVRRPHDAALARDGSIPVLGEGCWRAGLARYDVRW
jgi:hypothetical protein